MSKNVKWAVIQCLYFTLKSLHVLVGLLPLTFWRLAKVAIFTTNVDAENQCLINHKCVCGALNRHFCQTPVMPSPFFHCLNSFVTLRMFCRLCMQPEQTYIVPFLLHIKLIIFISSCVNVTPAFFNW